MPLPSAARRQLRSACFVSALILPFLFLGACGDDGSTNVVSPPTTGGAAGLGGAGGTSGSGAGGAAAGGGGASAGSGGSAGRAGAAGAAPGSCTVDADCPATVFVTKPANCAEGFCDGGRCAYRARDDDGDGSRRNRCEITSDGTYTLALGKDCDDGDANVNPNAWDGPAGEGHPNTCGDGVDQNCSGIEGDDLLANGTSCACVPGDVRNCAQTAAGAPISFPGGSPAPGSICAFGSQTCVKDPLAGGLWGPCIGAIAPALEVCNGADDNCDGRADEPEAADALEYAYDGDGDGFAAVDPTTKKAFATRRGCVGTPPTTAPVECTPAYCGDVPIATCCPASGWRTFTRPGDCNDREGAISPGELERCNKIDDNCDGKIDDGGSIGERPYLYDGDGDGYADTKQSAVLGCSPPCGALTPSECAKVWRTDIPLTDCNDGNAAISPGVAENCTTAVDDNCNGSTTDGCDCVYDAQNPQANAQDCGTPDDCVYVPKGSVCQPNGKYSSCPGAIPKEEYCLDDDGDGACLPTCGMYCERGKLRFPAPATHTLKTLCRSTPTGLIEDCNDDRSSVFPGATERCGDDVDQNCANGPNEGYESLGTACDIYPGPDGKSVGACIGGGSLVCAGTSTTTIKCNPNGAGAGPGAGLRPTPAPNGSWDWNCDGGVEIQVSVPQTFAIGNLGCRTSGGTFSPNEHVTTEADWGEDELRLVDQQTADALSCDKYKTFADCRDDETRFYAITCSNGVCQPPTCATPFRVLRCNWKNTVNPAICENALLPQDQGTCPDKTTKALCR